VAGRIAAVSSEARRRSSDGQRRTISSAATPPLPSQSFAGLSVTVWNGCPLVASPLAWKT